MLKFHCKNCNQKISVPEIHAGKKGKCPKCKSVVVIPKLKETGPAAGKSGSNDFKLGPKITDADLSFLDVPEQYKIADQPENQDNRPAGIYDADRELEEGLRVEETDSAGKRKLPWPIDILLYPASIPGVTTVGVIVIVQLLARFLCCVNWIIQIIMSLYLYWYFCECIRDSAAGGLRAPETVGSMAGLGEMFFQSLRLFTCYAFFLGPVTFYRGYTAFSDFEMNNLIFWSLITYAVFFFPMGTLAVVMFGSVKGLNPVLIVSSIVSTFLQYCGLVILFYGLGLLFIIGIMGSLLSGVAVGPILSIVLTFIFSLISFVWLLFVAGHLLGRFYWRYQEKLNWEV